MHHNYGNTCAEEGVLTQRSTWSVTVGRIRHLRPMLLAAKDTVVCKNDVRALVFILPANDASIIWKCLSHLFSNETGVTPISTVSGFHNDQMESILIHKNYLLSAYDLSL